jgi:DNA-binding Xre family transcriptional regulator
MRGSALSAGRVGAVCRLLGIRSQLGDLPEARTDAEFSRDAGCEGATRLPPVDLAQDLAESPGVAIDQFCAFVDAQAAPFERRGSLERAAIHRIPIYGQKPVLSRDRMALGCQMPALRAVKLLVAKAKARPKKIVAEWRGFADRLKLAVSARMRERDVSQNSIADAVGIESGQFSKILSGERALGLTVNTLLLIAEALDVRPLWLMTGEEPSGIRRAKTTSTPPAHVENEPVKPKTAAR